MTKTYLKNEVEGTDAITCTKKQWLTWAKDYFAEQPDFESLRDDDDGITVMRTDDKGFTYQAERAAEYVVRPGSKLEWVEDWTGLEAAYGGGDYTVTVWQNTDWDKEPGHDYEFIYCKSDTDIAHNREMVSAEKLETEMRKYCSDLRKWCKIEHGNQTNY